MSNVENSSTFFWAKTIWLSPLTIQTYRVKGITDPTKCPVSGYTTTTADEELRPECYYTKYSGANIEDGTR